MEERENRDRPDAGVKRLRRAARNERLRNDFATDCSKQSPATVRATTRTNDHAPEIPAPLRNRDRAVPA